MWQILQMTYQMDFLSIGVKFEVYIVLLLHPVKNLSDQKLLEVYKTATCQSHGLVGYHNSIPIIIADVDAERTAVFPDIDAFHQVTVKENDLQEGEQTYLNLLVAYPIIFRQSDDEVRGELETDLDFALVGRNEEAPDSHRNGVVEEQQFWCG